jgi:hypothetical protein
LRGHSPTFPRTGCGSGCGSCRRCSFIPKQSRQLPFETFDLLGDLHRALKLSN